MLVKGTIKSNLLTTEMGQFFVSRKGTEEMSGVFELSQIQASSIEKSVEVDGFNAVVKIPVLEAKIVGIYSQLYTKAKQPKYKEATPKVKKETDQKVSEIKPEEDSILSVSSDTQKTKEILDMFGDPVCDEVKDDLKLEVKLFGKPLKGFGERYKIDASLPRAKQQEIISYLQSKNTPFETATQDWLIQDATL